MFEGKCRLVLGGKKGFTLVELLVTLAVLAILASIGLPSFQRLVADYRVSSQANGVQGALQFARSEALKRRANTIACVDGDMFLVGVGNDCASITAAGPQTLRVLGIDGRVEFDGFPLAGLAFAPSGYTADRTENNLDFSHPLVATRRVRVIASGFSDIERL